MLRPISWLAVLGFTLLSFACAGRNSEAAEQPAPVSPTQKVEAALERGELDSEARPSIDALVDDFIAALGANDKQALTKLRVTESEYLDIIVPGGVAVGEPPRRNTPKVKEFFWALLNEKSYTYGEQFLKQFGGRKYTRTNLTFTEPTKHYAWYDAYGEIRLQMTDEEGNTWDLRSGFIADVGGKYKFIGYQYD